MANPLTSASLIDKYQCPGKESVLISLPMAGAGDTSFFDTNSDTETCPASGRFRYRY